MEDIMPEHYTHINKYVRIMKRFMDILITLIAFLMLLPFIPIIALLIKLDSPGPVFFMQKRIGEATPEYTALFNMIKFRTMRVDAEKNGAQWAQKNDNRITRVGKFLRKTRLDEIPQFWNVLKGDMSIIGPRPERPGFYSYLEENITFYSERTYGLKPGITGLAQVKQGYDESIEDVRHKVGYDHAYALSLGNFSHWALMELSILWQTVTVVIYGRGQ